MNFPGVPSIVLLRRVSNATYEPSRREHEASQCRVRVALILASCCYLYWLGLQPDIENSRYVVLGFVLSLLSLAVSTVLLAASWFDIAPLRVRVSSGVLHDVSFIALAMYFGGAGSAPFAFLWVLVTLTNGFRFGALFLYYSAILSVIAFGCVYFASEYWQSQGVLSTNLVFVLTVIPVYLGRLLSSLQQAKSKLQLRASADPLTGLLNRAGFEARAAELLDSGDAKAEHVILFCDLDQFKDVNDRAGHAAGDKLLADVAALISKCVRSIDVCGRLGGDEFCLRFR